MTNLRKPPGPVIAAAVISALFGLLFLAVGVGTLFSEGPSDGSLVGLVIALVALGLAWTLWQGSRAARISGIVIGAVLVLAGLKGLTSNGVAVFALASGLAMIVLLTVPASSRRYFSREPQTSIN